MRKNLSTRVTLVAGVVFAAACGPAVLRDQHAVKFTAGGQVVYQGDGSPLAGVTISLVGPEGTPASATTDSAGLWSVDKLNPGVYAAHYELAGYEPVDSTVDLSAFGPNQVSNPFVAVPTVDMTETVLRASISPFAVTLESGETLTDGYGGNVMVYSVGADGAIAVTFPYRVFGGQVRLVDGQTQQQINATLDTATNTTFTFSKTAIDTINGGGAQGVLSNDTDPYTYSRIQISNIQSFSPIHGDPEQMSGSIYFNATP